MLYLLLLSIFLQVGFSNGANLILIDKKKKHEPVLWLINRPPRFQSRLRYEGILENVTRHSAKAQQFEDMRSHYFQYPDRHTEYGEMVDALDHYFWGMTRGLALEVGALDGSDTRYSRTFGFESQFNWSRILIEADPRFREGLLEKSPSAFTVNATVCATPKQVHYVYSRHFAGILEYMTPDFLRRHHNHIYKSLTPYGNVSSIDVTHLRNVTAVGCTPMYHILQEAHIRHINFVVISTEGSEYEVLRSFAWHRLTIDVFCICTDAKNRPPDYEAKVTRLLVGRGFYPDSVQQGPNTWYVRKGFVRSIRPGTLPDCFLGALKATSCPPKKLYI